MLHLTQKLPDITEIAFNDSALVEGNYLKVFMNLPLRDRKCMGFP